jgi:hypothetical protein
VIIFFFDRTLGSWFLGTTWRIFVCNEIVIIFVFFVVVCRSNVFLEVLLHQEQRLSFFVRESFTAIGEQTSPTDMLEVVFEVVQLGSDSEKYGILSPSQAKCQRTI